MDESKKSVPEDVKSTENREEATDQVLNTEPSVDTEDGECAVCLALLSSEASVIHLECGHSYHTTCVVEAMLESSAARECAVQCVTCLKRSRRLRLTSTNDDSVAETEEGTLEDQFLVFTNVQQLKSAIGSLSGGDTIEVTPGGKCDSNETIEMLDLVSKNFSGTLRLKIEDSFLNHINMDQYIRVLSERCAISHLTACFNHENVSEDLTTGCWIDVLLNEDPKSVVPTATGRNLVYVLHIHPGFVMNQETHAIDVAAVVIYNTNFGNVDWLKELLQMLIPFLRYSNCEISLHESGLTAQQLEWLCSSADPGLYCQEETSCRTIDDHAAVDGNCFMILFEE